MSVESKINSIQRDDLFQKDGLYYARLHHSPHDEPIEIALHGILCEEQARVAIAALNRSCLCKGLM